MNPYQHHLDEEGEIVLAIKNGAIDHPELNAPDTHIETGLAHVFFFGERVFKQYKIVSDPDHFIKGALAPTEKRFDFLERDFTLNQHVSGGIYKEMYTHERIDGSVKFVEYKRTSPHVWFEMERLDFSQNFHEQLLRGEVTDVQLYALGYYTAKLVAESPVAVPEGLNWYELATQRVSFLEQFLSWLPVEYKIAMDDTDCVAVLKQHLENHKKEYESIMEKDLVVSLDNHDENIFFKDNKPLFIDVVPPMQSWWYGVPWLNLANIVVNVETLLSEDSAKIVEAGFMDYNGIKELPKKDYAFARALAYAISVAHFGSLPEKAAVAELYLERCKKIKEWL